MERRDRKRKVQEIADSTLLVNETISELASELAQSDAILRSEISSLKDEVATLKQQLGDKSAQYTRLEEEAAFLHPQAVIDRIRTKLWHHGDLSLLNKVIDPRRRVLRNTEARGERNLFLCEAPTKKVGYKVVATGSQMSELPLKREGEEESTAKSMSPRLSPIASPKNTDMATIEEKEEEVVTPSESQDDLSKISPPKDVLTDPTLMDCAQ
ncbi:hypothetical protein PRIC2_010324 [Phytophthora ramorum]